MASDGVRTNGIGVQTSVADNLLPEVKSYGRAYDRGQGLWDGDILGYQDAGVNQGQEAALNAIPGIQGMLDQQNNTLQGFLDYDPNSFQNQASRNALGANVTSAFNESIRPGIEDRFTNAGQYGGYQQQNAIGAATAPLSRALADGEVGLMNADRNRAMNALQLSPGLINQNLLPSQIMGDVGSQRTQRNQMHQFNNIQKSEAERTNRLRSLQEMSGLYGGLGGFEQSGLPAGPSAASGAISGALGGAATGFAVSAGNPVGAVVGGVAGGLGALI
jgi:hypothetical protein